MSESFDTQSPCYISPLGGLMLCGSWVSQVQMFSNVACWECYSFFSDGRAIWNYIEENAPEQREYYTYRVNGDMLEMSVTGRSMVVRARFKIFSNDCQSILALNFEGESDVVILKQELNHLKSAK